MSARLICAALAVACLATSAPAQTASRRDSAGPVSPDVFGTAAVAAGVTVYDSRFRRVSNTDNTHPLVLKMAESLAGLTPEQQLTAVFNQVKQKVRWSSDLDEMRVADLWANAGETLERGAGDSEDIATVEMQVLKAAGWNPRDLYISIGRERRVGTHIVLLARAPSGFYVLDDRANRPATTQEYRAFTPIMTLGAGKSWIHGRRIHGGSARLSAR
jgi:predicted transglutaminase-like cysteine proteinase